MLPVIKLPPFIEYLLGAGHGVVVGILCIMSFNCYYVDIHHFTEEEIQVQGAKVYSWLLPKVYLKCQLLPLR